MDEGNRKVLVDGEDVALSGKPFDVLVCLLRANGQLVSKSELFERVWPGRIVTDASLSKSVRQIRIALGDDDRKLLRTVHGHGFRLEMPAQAETEPAGIDFDLFQRPEATRCGAASEPCLYVAPFTGVSDQADQDVIRDSIWDDIISDLGRLEAVTVVPRNTTLRIAARNWSAGRIANALSISHLVEGSVTVAGNHVRVHIRIQVADRHETILERRYDRPFGEIFLLKDELTTSIIRALSPQGDRLVAGANVGRGTTNAEAYRYFVMGRQLHRRRTNHYFPSIRTYFERAIALDPEFAEAWMLLARAHYLDDTDPEAGELAAKAIDRALQIAPDYGEAHATRARIMLAAGRQAEAREAIEKALATAGESFLIEHSAAHVMLALHQFESALSHALNAERLDDDQVGPFLWAAQAQRALGDSLGMRDSARTGVLRAEQQLANDPSNLEALVCGLVLHAYLNDYQQFREYSDRALLLDARSPNLHWNIVSGLVIMGRHDEAISQLEQSAPLITPVYWDWSRVDSDMTPIWKDQRFVEYFVRNGNP